MGVKINKIPELNDPVLVASWPGIGNVGLLAVDTIRDLLQAEEFGYIEPMEFFYPKSVLIRDGEIISVDFPSSKFYYRKTEKRDIVFFIGEEQPVWNNKPYAEGAKAYEMAELVIDVAKKLGCRRIFTSGAAVTNIHHSMRSRIWVVPNNSRLITEIKSWQNAILMSQAEDKDGQGSITGLNGLLLGMARKCGIDAICVMGEIPVYLQGFPILYPKGSRSVMELFSQVLDIELDLTGIEEFAAKNEKEINNLYDSLPADAKAQLDEYVNFPEGHNTEKTDITEEDKKIILDELDKYFKNGITDENDN